MKRHTDDLLVTEHPSATYAWPRTLSLDDIPNPVPQSVFDAGWHESYRPAPVVELADGWSEYTPPAERTAEYVPVARATRTEPLLVWWLVCAVPLGVALGLLGSVIYGAGA